MKSLLPTSIKLSVNKKGFTLIELMVVVAIIAILSVIGFAIFQNAQKNTRDGIRRGEINNLAKSIESAKDPTQANYFYNGTNVSSNPGNFERDYPTNKPSDPSKLATGPFYCIATSAGTALTRPPLDPDSWPIGTPTGCPNSQAGEPPYYFLTVYIAGPPPFVFYNPTLPPGVNSNALNNNTPPIGVRYWKICARLEVPATNNWFCAASAN